MWAGWEGCGCMYVVVVALSRIFKALLLSIASLIKQASNNFTIQSSVL